MIDTSQAVILAIIQGFTEFLPISSSAHLLLPSQLLGWQDQGLAFDVAVHLGSLTAVLIYYRYDVMKLIAGGCRPLYGQALDDEGRLAWLIVLASVPAALVGFFAGDFIESNLRVLPVIATTTLLFGLLLAWADRKAVVPGVARSITLPIAVVIGLAQAVAPVPGVSRSGVTITAALFLGLDRQQAARFSFLLSIPVIAGAGLLKGLDLLASTTPVPWGQLLLASTVSGITAYTCIALFLRFIERIGMMPFVIYRVALAAVLYGIWIM